MDNNAAALAALPDLKLLQLFDLLYDVRNVSRVAEQLGQSQPTVSIWLGQLRDYIRDPLFIRTPGGMAPTPQADALIGPCREILESLRRFAAWEIAFDPATAQRRFRICMTDASHITLLPRLLAHVRAQAPGVRLEAARIDGNTERTLESGEADLAIGYVPWLSGGIYQQQLYEQDWVCLANRHHPRIHTRFGVKQYSTEGHVAVTAGTGAQLLQQALTRERIERQIVLELPGFLGLGAIIQTSAKRLHRPMTWPCVHARSPWKALPCGSTGMRGITMKRATVGCAAWSVDFLALRTSRWFCSGRR